MDDTTLDAIEARQKAAASARWEIIGGRDGPRALMALLGEDVPALVAEVRGLVKYRDWWKASSLANAEDVRRLTAICHDWRDRSESAEAEVVTLRARLAEAEALAEEWRYKGQFGWGAWQLGEGPDPEGYVMDHCASALLAALAGSETDTSDTQPTDQDVTGADQ